ncbi:MAG: hypothetical protein E2P06_12755 [Acidobacteria bacterium]|nr:hypothetical protein [Acidobacteriota bacterium]TDI22406.1 MAG: hypothetical protein E2P06_12755 [Acidobacteriota bacterium]
MAHQRPDADGLLRHRAARHADRYGMNGDQGNIILARVTPDSNEDQSRTTLLEPTTSASR